MKIIYKKVSELIPYVNNPRKNDKAVDAVASSIKNYGFRNAILIDAKNEIINGHTRLKAAQKLGMLEVPCVMAEDLTPSQVKGLRIADNKVAEAAEWDYDLLKIELDDIDDFTGFDLKDLNLNDKEITEDDFNTDEALQNIEQPISKRGDIWKLGNHRLMCGDSTSVDDVEKLMDGKKAQISFTSPPYNAGKSEKLSGNTHMTDNKYLNYKDENINYLNLLLNFTKNIINVSEYCFINLQQLAGNKIDVIDYLYNYKDNFVDVCIWKKTNTSPAMAESVMNSQFEYIFIFKNEKKPTRAIKTVKFRGTVSNVYEGSPQRNNEFSDIHSATFPIHLPFHFVEKFTKRNCIILDCFGGTGTTLIACEQTERICYMMELDEKYCDVIIKRWETLTGKKAEKVV